MAALDAAQQTGARVVLISTIVTHGDVHEDQMRHLAEEAAARGLREHLVLVAGGTQVSDASARACGLDGGFGRGTTGRMVGSFLVRQLRRAEV